MAGRGRSIKRIVDSGKNQEKNVESRIRLMAKYSYNPNADMPGGFKEIGLKQFDKLWLLKKGFGENMHWWEVENDDGECGFAPAQYLTMVEEGAASMPWLQNDPEPPTDQSPGNQFGQPKVKRYVSAYSENKKEQDYYCTVCERGFNGPVPFKAHMNSKAHKEEMIVQEYYRC